ncbi:DUF2000 domain-containing protein [Nonomuraea sediminis]|uniref:DUF2000 domain-containing protein n=1 Tax=Nonomuraea sediminis TaxID=2835864 RepID=UPI001BDD3C31|nr:DUF2000 domain-containing protein [Nonomuraea sediminis]
MRFDTKIAIVVRSDLAVWQKLNVTAFLASAVAGSHPETIGAPYLDGSGVEYLSMFRQPVLVYGASYDELAQIREKAKSRGLDVAVYIDEMFKTGHDMANRETVQAVESADLRLAGLAVHGPKNALDKTLKGLSLHP